MSVKVNLILQGKGGVGKSMIASFLCQYHKSKGSDFIAIDTDPINTTLKRFDNLDTVYIDILEDNKINDRKFDLLIESIAEAQQNESSENVNIIIDNGASSFVPLNAYLVENNVQELFTEMGIEVIYHTIVTGGQAMNDTLEGLKKILDYSDNIFVWKNEYYGKVENNGKQFEESKFYKDNSKKIKAIININKKNQNTFQADVEEMLAQHITFDEAILHSNFKLMSKQRLKVIKKEIFDDIENAGL